MDKWKDLKQKWESQAASSGRTFEIELWDETAIASRLTRPANRGRIRYFFNREEFTPEWFRDRVEDVARDAYPRYTDELNVQLPIGELFEGLARTDVFERQPRQAQGVINHAAAWLNSRPVHPDDLQQLVTDACNKAADLVSSLRSLEFRGVQELPLQDLSKQARNVYDAAWRAHDALRERDDALGDEERKAWESGPKTRFFHYSQKFGTSCTELRTVANGAQEIVEFARSDKARVASQARLLISGSAGKGKTHLLVDVAKRRIMAGMPAIVILGENIANRDPMTQIIELLGISADTDEFMQALDAAGEASGERLLFMIDALNEGAGLTVWPNRLAGFLANLARYRWIGVALSIRTTYEDAVIPTHVLESTTRVVHEGFASKPEEAARAFFTYYGINLPSIPLLNPEFTDPLFLKILCKGLQSEGLKDIPQGYEGISKVFQFIVSATDRKLQKSGLVNALPGSHVVRDFLDIVADELALSGTQAIPMAQAFELSQAVYRSNGYQGSLLASLISEGLLSREMLRTVAGAQPEECIAFAYQRFGDHEIARRLIHLHDLPSDPQAPYRPDGEIGRLFVENQNVYSYLGILEALSIQVPERYGFEPIEALVPDPKVNARDAFRVAEITGCFIDGLAWRSASSITAATIKTIGKYARTRHHHDKVWSIYLMLCAVPDHPLNAHCMHRILASRALADRDQFWLEWLREHQYSEGVVDRLLTWSLLPDNKNHLSDESVQLASMALAWITASTVRHLRDRATKGLVRLLTPRPHLVGTILDAFAGVDDLYIIERLYAAAYGISLRIQSANELAALANDVYNHLFNQDEVLPHLMVRDYARCVVERAVLQGCSLPFDSAKCRPPFGSSLPAEPPSKEYFENLVQPSGEWTDHDRAYSNVVNRFKEFDVSEYAGGPSLRWPIFTTAPIAEERPLSKSEVEDRWDASLNEMQLEAWEAYRAGEAEPYFKILNNAIQRTSGNSELADEDESPSASTLGIPGADLDSLLANLESVLSVELKETLHRVIQKADDPDEYKKYLLDLDLVASWMSKGAIDLGWSPERFATFDAMIGRSRDSGRSQSREETAGAKYLWMSYLCVLARLADNYYLDEDIGKPMEVFDGSWQLSLRTIDPSLLPCEQTAQPGLVPWWSPQFYNPAESQAHDTWLRDEQVLPAIRDQLWLKDDSGRIWITLETYPAWDQPLKPEEDRFSSPHRNLWYQLRGYLVQEVDADAFVTWAKDQWFMGRWMPEGDANISNVFLGEFYGSLAWNYRSQHDRRDGYWRSVRETSFRVAPVSIAYDQNSDDTSMVQPVTAFIPAKILMDGLNLIWTGEGASWGSPDGDVLLQDPSLYKGGRQCLVVRKDTLDSFLHKKGLRLIWTVLGEKIIHAWNARYPRLEVSGVAEYSGDGIGESVATRFVGNGYEKAEEGE